MTDYLTGNLSFWSFKMSKTTVVLTEENRQFLFKNSSHGDLKKLFNSFIDHMRHLAEDIDPKVLCTVMAAGLFNVKLTVNKSTLAEA